MPKKLQGYFKMLSYWSLKFLKSLSLKLSHLCVPRCYIVVDFWSREVFLTRPKFHLINSSGSRITEKIRGDGEKWFIPTYTLKGCISQKRRCLYYIFKVQFWKSKNVLNIEKRYWKKILKISHFEVLS